MAVARVRGTCAAAEQFGAGVVQKPKPPWMTMDPEKQIDWFQEGHGAGVAFARFEADYDELAAVCRAGTIPGGWDLYRARIRNRHLGVKDFDFQAYATGFARACLEFYEKI